MNQPRQQQRPLDGEWQMRRFRDKVDIGAGSGVGAAAGRFADEGANVVLVDRVEDRLTRVAAGLPADRSLTFAVDVFDFSAADAVVRAAMDLFAHLHYCLGVFLVLLGARFVLQDFGLHVPILISLLAFAAIITVSIVVSLFTTRDERAA